MTSRRTGAPARRKLPSHPASPSGTRSLASAPMPRPMPASIRTIMRRTRPAPYWPWASARSCRAKPSRLPSCMPVHRRPASRWTRSRSTVRSVSQCSICAPATKFPQACSRSKPQFDSTAYHFPEDATQNRTDTREALTTTYIPGGPIELVLRLQGTQSVYHIGNFQRRHQPGYWPGWWIRRTVYGHSGPLPALRNAFHVLAPPCRPGAGSRSGLDANRARPAAPDAGARNRRPG